MKARPYASAAAAEPSPPPLDQESEAALAAFEPPDAEHAEQESQPEAEPAEPRAEGEQLWDEIASLEAQLQEKEQLVQALTNRLEQAAEQLDRVHRTGGDRRAHIGGFPPELIQQQKELVDELQTVVRSWEDMQAALTLGRIETQVMELRDLIAQRVGGGGGTPAPVRGEAPGSGSSVLESLRGLKRPKDEAPESAGWEALKASLLNGDSSAPAPTPEGPQPSQTADMPEEPLELDGAPAAVDVDTLSAEDLRQAVRARDEFIAQLARNVRRLNVRRRPPEDWGVLAAVPDELVENVRRLERQLEENLRLAEVELSLERAKLGREETRLREWDEQLQKEAARRLPAAKETDESESGKGRRWLRMLGANNKRGQE